MSEPGVRILLVEDDDGIATPLAAALEGQGHVVHRVATGREALDRAAGVDAVILDLGLPDMDGLEVCRRLRRDGRDDLPILMLTARAGEMDLVVGLDAGADDYVAKPFRLAELLARLRALLRRTQTNADEAHLSAGPIRVDRDARRVWLSDREIDLTPTEFDLLVTLVRRAGSVAARDEIVREVWDTDWVGNSRTLDMHVSALRRKLDDDPSAPRHVVTVRGIGFRFDP